MPVVFCVASLMPGSTPSHLWSAIGSEEIDRRRTVIALCQSDRCRRNIIRIKHIAWITAVTEDKPDAISSPYKLSTHNSGIIFIPKAPERIQAANRLCCATDLGLWLGYKTKRISVNQMRLPKVFPVSWLCNCLLTLLFCSKPWRQFVKVHATSKTNTPRRC